VVINASATSVVVVVAVVVGRGVAFRTKISFAAGLTGSDELSSGLIRAQANKLTADLSYMDK